MRDGERPERPSESAGEGVEIPCCQYEQLFQVDSNTVSIFRITRVTRGKYRVIMDRSVDEEYQPSSLFILVISIDHIHV